MAFSLQIAPQERFALRNSSKGDTVGVVWPQGTIHFIEDPNKNPGASSSGVCIFSNARKTYAALRSTIIFLIWAMALAGLRPLGQTLAQFMIVWQR